MDAIDIPSSDSVHSLYGRTGGTITLPAGVVYHDSPINWHGLNGVTIEGHPDGTTLVYIGPPCDAAVDIRGAFRCTFRKIAFQNRSDGVYSSLMCSSLPHNGGHGGGASANVFEDLVFDWNSGTPLTAVRLSVGPRKLYEADANNDWPIIRGCRFVGYEYAGLRFNGSQIHSALIENCDFANYARSGQYGIAWDYGVFGHVRRCAFTGNKTSDVYAAGNAVSLRLEGCNSENSNAFLVTGNSAASWPIEISWLRWDGRGVEGGKGTPVICNRHAGPLTVTNSVIGCPLGGFPEIAVDNPQGVLRMDRTSFASWSDPSKRAMVRQWGKDCDAKADACDVTWVRPGANAWPKYKVPADPTKAVK